MYSSIVWNDSLIYFKLRWFLNTMNFLVIINRFALYKLKVKNSIYLKKSTASVYKSSVRFWRNLNACSSRDWLSIWAWCPCTCPASQCCLNIQPEVGKGQTYWRYEDRGERYEGNMSVDHWVRRIARDPSALHSNWSTIDLQAVTVVIKVCDAFLIKLSLTSYLLIVI